MDSDNDLELYDEFGNYIGPDLDEEVGDAAGVEDLDLDVDLDLDDAGDAGDVGGETMDEDTTLDRGMEAVGGSVVLHEEKEYYPSAQQVYGEDVEVLVQDEDTQLLTTPIIAPEGGSGRETARFAGLSAASKGGLPLTTYDKAFLLDLLETPDLNRNIVVAGALHHGKTALVDLLVEETHTLERKKQEKSKLSSKLSTSTPKSTLQGGIRFSDTHPLERKRGMSIKATVLSLLHADSKSKSHGVTWIDTPGHVNFNDEVVAGIALADGAVVVVDVIEGVTAYTATILRQLSRSGVPITLLINKIDRLILELRLPPADAYFKIKSTLEEVNTVLNGVVFRDPTLENLAAEIKPQRLSPELGNVVFGSTKYGYIFSLKSFAQKYSDLTGSDVHLSPMASRLWGDYYYDSTKNSLSKKRSNNTSDRTFVRFILEPLYKITSRIVTDKRQDLFKVMPKVGVYLKKTELQRDPKELLKLILSRMIGTTSSLIDTILINIPPPTVNAERKTKLLYNGLENKFKTDMYDCNQRGSLVGYVVKLVNLDDPNKFYALTRIMSGKITIGQNLKVLGESFTPEDNEDSADATVKSLIVPVGKYGMNVEYAKAGSIVLIGGVDATLIKTGTIVSLQDFEKYEDEIDDSIRAFNKLKLEQPSIMKLAIDPLNPSELPKMLDSVRKVLKTFPALETHVEESGEHSLFGPGEIYLDCVMHDLRNLYSGIEIKVSDPMVKFSETVNEVSGIKSVTTSVNGHNKITMIAEPLDSKLANDIETGEVTIDWANSRQLSRQWSKKYDWDVLRVRSVWAFGPNENGANVLINDTFQEDETDESKNLNSPKLRGVKESIKQGFRWATREGPLTEEPMRGVNFKIMDVVLSTEPIYRGGGQIIPIVRKATYGAFLTANPKLLEPIYTVELQTPSVCLPMIYGTVSRRRGKVIRETPKPGTPLTIVTAEMPTIDSFGFETDIRVQSQGQVFCQMAFSHWQTVPGNPLDADVEIPSLKPAVGESLARDFLLKTRRRKGLSDELSLGSLIDPSMITAALSL